MDTPSSSINYFNEETELPDLPINTTEWLTQIAKNHLYTIQEINYIFCTDEYLLNVNKEYLDHDYYTDIITFDNSDVESDIESDIFISIDRVNDNADTLSVPRGTELRRVMAHGLLHLCGFKDKSEDEAKEMRSQEENCLTLWSNTFDK